MEGEEEPSLPCSTTAIPAAQNPSSAAVTVEPAVCEATADHHLHNLPGCTDPPPSPSTIREVKEPSFNREVDEETELNVYSIALETIQETPDAPDDSRTGTVTTPSGTRLSKLQPVSYMVPGENGVGKVCAVDAEHPGILSILIFR